MRLLQYNLKEILKNGIKVFHDNSNPLKKNIIYAKWSHLANFDSAILAPQEILHALLGLEMLIFITILRGEHQFSTYCRNPALRYSDCIF